jgi:hypothetical protein
LLKPRRALFTKSRGDNFSLSGGITKGRDEKEKRDPLPVVVVRIPFAVLLAS